MVVIRSIRSFGMSWSVPVCVYNWINFIHGGTSVGAQSHHADHSLGT
jgi:hypothetical protein